MDTITVTLPTWAMTKEFWITLYLLSSWIVMGIIIRLNLGDKICAEDAFVFTFAWVFSPISLIVVTAFKVLCILLKIFLFIVKIFTGVDWKKVDSTTSSKSWADTNAC